MTKTKHQLNVWKNRGFITYCPQTGLYSKTQEYLKGCSNRCNKIEQPK